MVAVHRLRVQFSVQELDEEGRPTDGGRFLTFSDDCVPAAVRELFDRAGRSITTIFGSGGAWLVRNTGIRWANKIQAIKLHRELTGMGLKESKDAIERVDGRLVVCPDEATARHVARRFDGLAGVGSTAGGVNGLVVAEPVDLRGLVRGQVDVPALTDRAVADIRASSLP